MTTTHQPRTSREAVYDLNQSDPLADERLTLARLGMPPLADDDFTRMKNERRMIAAIIGDVDGDDEEVWLPCPVCTDPQSLGEPCETCWRDRIRA